MEGISDIRICGFDETRPPRMRKEPYIDLFFKISHKAPEKWCEDFNQLTSKNKYPAKIEASEGLFIATWVRKPEEVEAALESLKVAVSACNDSYIARIEAEARAGAEKGDKPENEGAQGVLNRIVAGLNFDA